MGIDNIIEETTNINEMRQPEPTPSAAPATQQRVVVTDGGQEMTAPMTFQSILPTTRDGWMMALQGAQVLLLAILVFIK